MIWSQRWGTEFLASCAVEHSRVQLLCQNLSKLTEWVGLCLHSLHFLTSLRLFCLLGFDSLRYLKKELSLSRSHRTKQLREDFWMNFSFLSLQGEWVIVIGLSEIPWQKGVLFSLFRNNARSAESFSKQAKLKVYMGSFIAGYVILQFQTKKVLKLRYSKACIPVFELKFTHKLFLLSKTY